MSDEKLVPSRSPAQLQEAIDTIVEAFDHPEAISIDHTLDDGEKQTIFEVTAEDGVNRYELVYAGRDDAAEPEFVPLD